MIKRSFRFAFIILTAFVLVNSCTKQVVTKEVQVVEVVDSVKLLQLQHELRAARDSIKVYQADTFMNSEEFTLRYKLERIRYYNDIAKNGNNIKYLRGWINRVLNE